MGLIKTFTNNELVDSTRNGWTVLWSGKGFRYDGNIHRSLICMCMCGRIKEIRTHDFLSGRSKNCGCFRENSGRKYSSHSSIRRDEYGIWKNMRRRCHNLNNSRYHDYGGRGITVFEKWRESFQEFYDYIGPRPSKSHTLDRINNNGNYEPGNVRWATIEEQYRNKRNTRMLTYNNFTRTMAEWSRIVHIPPNTIRGRIEMGWTTHEALTKPIFGKEKDIDPLKNNQNEYFNNNVPSPTKDGIEHINIYSKGKTELGKLLSNFAYSPFEHKVYGKFNTIEGFWHWLKTDKQYDIFRKCSGAEAKSMSKNYSFVLNKDFKAEIKKFILLKIEQNEKIRELLKASTLPLTHYYYYGTEENGKVVVPDNSKWVIDHIELIRDYLNNKAYKLIIAGSREITDYETVKKAYLSSGLKAIEVVSGTARGVDRLGEQLAKELELPVERFPADWDNFPKVAGFLRNDEMAIYATGLLAVWDGKSTGTQDMVKRMKTKNKLVIVSS